MKKYTLIAFLLTAALALSACNTEDNIQVENGEGTPSESISDAQPTESGTDGTDEPESSDSSESSEDVTETESTPETENTPASENTPATENTTAAATTTTKAVTTTTKATTTTTAAATTTTTAAATTTTAAATTTTAAPVPAAASTAEIVNAVKNAYGPDIPAIDALPEEMLGDWFGLADGTYTDVTAHVPMISTFVDTVAVVKAAPGKVGEVEAALKAYRDYLVNDSFQYPMNVAKVNASRVVVKGDYVMFIMLGAYDDRGDASDSERARFAEEQTQIGVDAFNALLA